MNFQKNLSFILAFGLLCSPLYGAQAAQKMSPYAVLQNEFPSDYLTSPQENNVSVDMSNTKEILAHVKNGVRLLTPEEARSFTLKMLAAADNTASEEQILDAAGRKDLEVVNQANLHTIIKRTNSLVGVMVQANLLTNPTRDVAELNNRQSIIRLCNTNKSLFTGLDKASKKMGAAEPVYLNLWKNVDATNEKLLKGMHYFNWLPFSNKNQTALEISRQTNNLFIAVPVAMLAWSAAHFKSEAWLASYFVASSAIKMSVYSLKMLYDRITLGVPLIKNLQTRLVGLGECVDALKEMSTLIKTHNLKGFDAITELFNPNSNHSADFKKLIGLLETNTFKGEASVFSFMGRVLAAHTLVQEVKNEFIPALEAAGKLDALLSTSKLLQEFESQRVHYCFAEFVEGNAPYLELTEFWNPLVNPKVVVTNDVTLGGQHARNMILTGPNTGGKSTVIKGITLNILLAQTFGIAAAKSMKLTPVAVMNTNINITDNVKENLSLFAAETARAKQILDSIENLGSNIGFCVFDETFRGTSPEQAEKLSCWYAKELAKHANVICLHATHYPTMIELEQQAPSLKNYKVEITKNEKGSLVRDYKLREGSTLTNVAEDILREQGLIR